MKQSDRMKLLVCDCIDTMSRQSDNVMKESAKGISEHLEDLLLNYPDEQVEDVCASSLVVMLAILKPLCDTMLASTSGRHARARKSEEHIFFADEPNEVFHSSED